MCIRDSIIIAGKPHFSVRLCNTGRRGLSPLSTASQNSSRSLGDINTLSIIYIVIARIPVKSYTVMSQITVEEFRNFFKYYKGEEHQMRAVDELYRNLDLASKDNAAKWIQLYRNSPEEAEKSSEKFQWPISKEEMATIMGCTAASLPDDLMDDYARCVETFGMDKLAQVYFLGQCGHESAGLRYPVEIHDGSNYCLLYTSPSPRDRTRSRMPSSA